MANDLYSPEYTRAEALDLWRVRVVERQGHFQRTKRSKSVSYDIALAFFFGLNFVPTAAKQMAEEVAGQLDA